MAKRPLGTLVTATKDEIVRRRKHYNEHRSGKRSFQANLRKDENDLVQAVKEMRRVTTDRELLLLLCMEEKQRQITTA